MHFEARKCNIHHECKNIVLFSFFGQTIYTSNLVKAYRCYFFAFRQVILHLVFNNSVCAFPVCMSIYSVFLGKSFQMLRIFTVSQFLQLQHVFMPVYTKTVYLCVICNLVVEKIYFPYSEDFCY